MLSIKQAGTIIESAATEWISLFRNNDGATNGTIIVKLGATAPVLADGTITIQFSNDWDGAKDGIISYTTTAINASEMTICYEVASPFRYVRFNFVLNTITELTYEAYGNYNTELPI